ncbi:cellulose binding domain-containing protein [Caldicellulosiruptor bescii]|nr:cellulose binding domain-containing protein [Caldicellulosiruptor bescii]
MDPNNPTPWGQWYKTNAIGASSVPTSTPTPTPTATPTATPTPTLTPTPTPTPTPTSTPTATPTATPTPTPTPSSTPVAGGQIKVLYANKETNSTTKYDKAMVEGSEHWKQQHRFEQGNDKVLVHGRWDKAQSAISDWAQIGASNVTFKFVKLSSSVSGADYYLEIGFKSGAGQLQAGKDTGRYR